MEYYVFVILLLIVFVVIFKLFLSNDEDFSGDLSDNLYINIETERYTPYSYYRYGCLSPYCRRRSWWFNDYTPLPWGNPTRFPRWIYPPYVYMTNYYRDYHGYY